MFNMNTLSKELYNDDIYDICNSLETMNIIHKPVLYDLMIDDFKLLADIYISNDNFYEYNLSLEPRYEHLLTYQNIKELIDYLYTNNNAQKILIQLILEKSDTIHIENITLHSFIDYYVDSFIKEKYS